MGAETSKDHGDLDMGGASVADFEAERARLREISRMDQTVRSRFSKGVRYNMKIVVRGSGKSGKTLLWRRLQGMPFSDQYEKSPEIQIATINWTSPSSAAEEDGAVKVEVWDVVDQAFRTPENSVNRISTADLVYTFKEEDAAVSEGKHALRLLDAQAVDVYRGANAVLFLVNPFDRASLDYVADQCKTVPGTVCILLMLSFRDQLEQATDQPQQQQQQVQVTLADVQALAALIGASRSDMPVNDVTVIQTSLRDGFGLLHLHHYLDLPLLRLKQRALQQQLAQVEADLHSRSEYIRDAVRGARYEDYLRQRQARLREMQSQQEGQEPAGGQLLKQVAGPETAAVGGGEGGTAGEGPSSSAAQATAAAKAWSLESGSGSPYPAELQSQPQPSSAGTEGGSYGSASGVPSSAATEEDRTFDRDGDSVQVQLSSVGGTEDRSMQPYREEGEGRSSSTGRGSDWRGEDLDLEGEEEETLSPFCVSPSTSSTVALSSTSVSAAATPRHPVGTVAPGAVAATLSVGSPGPGIGRGGADRSAGLVRARVVSTHRSHGGDRNDSISSSSDSESDGGIPGMAQKLGFKERRLQPVASTGGGRRSRSDRMEQQPHQRSAQSDGSTVPAARVVDVAVTEEGTDL